MRILFAWVTAILILTACGGGDERDKTDARSDKSKAVVIGPIGAPATLTKRLDFASCLAEDFSDDAAQSSRLKTVRPACASVVSAPPDVRYGLAANSFNDAT